MFRDFPREPRRSTAIASRRIGCGAQGRCAIDAELALLAAARAGAITYDKTALWLHTLERMLGWDTLQRILSTLLRALGSSSTRSPRTSSPSPTRSAAAI